MKKVICGVIICVLVATHVEGRSSGYVPRRYRTPTSAFSNQSPVTQRPSSVARVSQASHRAPVVPTASIDELDAWWRADAHSRAAFILPFYEKEGERFYLLGQESGEADRGTYSPFGGQWELTDLGPLGTASREFCEETGSDVSREYLGSRSEAIIAVNSTQDQTHPRNLVVFYLVKLNESDIHTLIRNFKKTAEINQMRLVAGKNFESAVAGMSMYKGSDNKWYTRPAEVITTRGEVIILRSVLFRLKKYFTRDMGVVSQDQKVHLYDSRVARPTHQRLTSAAAASFVDDEERELEAALEASRLAQVSVMPAPEQSDEQSFAAALEASRPTQHTLENFLRHAVVLQLDDQLDAQELRRLNSEAAQVIDLVQNCEPKRLLQLVRNAGILIHNLGAICAKIARECGDRCEALATVFSSIDSVCGHIEQKQHQVLFLPSASPLSFMPEVPTSGLSFVTALRQSGSDCGFYAMYNAILFDRKYPAEFFLDMETYQTLRTQALRVVTADNEMRIRELQSRYSFLTDPRSQQEVTTEIGRRRAAIASSNLSSDDISPVLHEMAPRVAICGQDPAQLYELWNQPGYFDRYGDVIRADRDYYNLVTKIAEFQAAAPEKAHLVIVATDSTSESTGHWIAVECTKDILGGIVVRVADSLPYHTVLAKNTVRLIQCLKLVRYYRPVVTPPVQQNEVVIQLPDDVGQEERVTEDSERARCSWCTFQ